MNFLGHAYLSFGNEEVLIGNMIGDYVKGTKALNNFPSGVARGITLHRRIDSFADKHPATTRAKLLFREKYGLYSGAIMDTLYDHFLANDSQCFPTESSLAFFTNRVYEILEKNSIILPIAFTDFFPYMKKQNWLFKFRTLEGMKKSLNGLQRRAIHMPETGMAFDIFVTNYYTLNQCYFEFMNDMTKFVKFDFYNGDTVIEI